METWDAIRSRRNVREYQDRPIPPEHLDRILEASRRTPSSQNLQRWEFVLVTDRERLRELSGVWRGAGHVGRAAAAIALLAPETADGREATSIHYDLGQATMSIMLAAADLGVGSSHAGVADRGLAQRVLGHPEDRSCRWIVALGYPKDRPLKPVERPDRRPFEDVVRRERW
ncbi:MAG TPA: nitroreductase family protein [Actinomycetota bacterium]